MKMDEWSKPKPATNGDYKKILKLKDKESAIGNFRGEIKQFYQHWVDNRSAVCAGRSVCEHCQSKDEEIKKASKKFRVNFIVKDPSGQLTPMIFEGGKKIYGDLIALNKDLPLENAWVKVSRNGEKQQTVWSAGIVPGMNGIVTPEEQNKILSIALHDVNFTQEAPGADAAFDDDMSA